MSLPRFVGKVLKAGPVRAVQQQFNLDFVKTGQHVGTDALGNKYYEDLTEHYGRDRWVEPPKWGYFDPSNIPAEWHGWIHKMDDHIVKNPEDQLRSKWMEVHRENPTGTPKAYKAYSTTTSKCQPWEPKVASRS
ncbi:MAG: NADH ubiquinone oxidoreductase subunit NDUFA12-domain-containing protein [Piptocephalis tieghemiana]|nr:MAG: NADH ubiquinone oxidoreductase subunit NDUFA12-domain-containing protein [Piptocephalis tieghemiana]